MAYLSINEFPGTGAIMQVEINFAGNRPGEDAGVTPYFNTADVKAVRVVPATSTSAGSETAVSLTFVNANTFRTAVSIPVGQVLRVYRDTQDEYGLVDFQALQLVTEDNLDTLARQTLFVAMEAKDAAALSGVSSKTAISTAVAANIKSDSAISTAGQALTQAGNAAQAATAAQAAASSAAQSSAAAAEYAQDVADLLANSESAASLAAALSSPTGSSLVGRGAGTVETALTNAETSIAKVINSHEKLIFKKKKILSLPLKCPEDAYMLATYNERFYPQAMCLDEDLNKLLIVGTGSTNKSVLVYNWPSGTFDRMFVCTGGTVTEGLVIRTEGSNKYLYIRTTGNKLGKYNITNYPANRAVIAEETILNVVCGLNFMEHNGTWTILDPDNNDLGNIPSRGKFLRTDAAFNPLGTIDCGSVLLGIYAGQPGDTSVSKAQGVCDTGYGLIASMGGQQVLTNTPSRYGENGLRVFTYDGELVAEGMLDPVKMAAKFASAWGLRPSLTENEGIIVNRAGEVFVLTVTMDYHNPNYAVEGMLITQEFCHDGVDFSDCAVSRSSVMRSFGQKTSVNATTAQFLDPILNTPITTLAGLLDAMQRSGLLRWECYTSSIVLTNIAGVAYPTGCKLTVEMYRSDIFYVKLEGFNTYRRWRVYFTGGVWDEQQTSDVLFAQTYSTNGGLLPGSVTFRRVSNTSLTISLVGTDGVQRSATLTLA